MKRDIPCVPVLTRKQLKYVVQVVQRASYSRRAVMWEILNLLGIYFDNDCYSDGWKTVKPWMP